MLRYGLVAALECSLLVWLSCVHMIDAATLYNILYFYEYCILRLDLWPALRIALYLYAA